MIRFYYPWALLLLLVIPLLAILRGRIGKRSAFGFSTVSAARIAGRGVKAQAGAAARYLRFLVLLMLVLALARPQQGKGRSEVEASGVDIMLVLDVSGSMEALDFKIERQPASRVEVVRQVVAKFVDDRPNDRIGLVAFAGRPYMMSPLTLDHDWLARRLQELRVGLVEDSTAIGSAISLAVNRLREQQAKSRIVILLTDGMNNAGKISPVVAAEAAAALGIKVYTIGAGSRGEAPMPVTDDFGRKRMVMAKVNIDEATLKEVARITKANYYRATDTTSLEEIYGEINKLEKTVHKMKKFENYRELFHLPLFCALFLMALEMLFSELLFRRLP